MKKFILSMADIEESVKRKIYKKCEYINNNFYPCEQLAKTFNFADCCMFNDIPKIMKEIAPVCPHCGFRFHEDPWVIIGWPYVCKSKLPPIEKIGYLKLVEGNNFVMRDMVNGHQTFTFPRKECYPVQTPLDFIPDDCKQIRIYHDGSWKTHNHHPECRGFWKNCPAELLPKNGQEFVVHSRPGWVK